jgi:hypothetical protein
MKLAAFLLLLGAPDSGTPDPAPPEIVVTPDDFLRDVRAGRLDAAYAKTSSAFQSYVRRKDFPSYVRTSRKEFDGSYTLSRPKVRKGKNCREESRTLLDVGVCEDGEQFRRLVFAWERGEWKFDHISTP